ncbi:unannotated protein [freshwater metagenome]|uniref:Unannotated protein n=1 Tax=freshwater metagenome TaxID=449393 RepID=A0A6J7CS98_9ZZZZ
MKGRLVISPSRRAPESPRTNSSLTMGAAGRTDPMTADKNLEDICPNLSFYFFK